MKLRDLPRKLRVRAHTVLQHAWIKYVRGPMSDLESRRALERSYTVGDPFKMTSDKEQFRFAETNRILDQGLIAPASRVGSILEIGCGEGHQSEYLSRLCDRLTGIDVVSAAVERARARVPGADLIAGELQDQPWVSDRHRFDIVTACEVIYYFKDIPGMLDTMSRLGRACLVTYHRPAAHLVERPLKAMPLAGRSTFAFENVEWRAAWWRSQ